MAARAVLVGIIFLSPFPLLSVAVQVLLTPWIILPYHVSVIGERGQTTAAEAVKVGREYCK